METIISLKQVSKTFSGRRVLSGISLNVKKGEHCWHSRGQWEWKVGPVQPYLRLPDPDSGQVCVRGQVWAKDVIFLKTWVC